MTRSIRIGFTEDLPFDAAVAEAFVEAARRIGIGNASIDVALLPGACEARLIDLPPIDSRNAARALRRDAVYFFPRVKESDPVAAAAQHRRRRDPPSGLTAIARDDVISAVHAAASGAGWKVNAIVPAHAAWLDAVSACALDTTPDPSGDGSCQVAITTGRQVVTLRVKSGRLVAMRRLPAGDPASAGLPSVASEDDAAVCAAAFAHRTRCFAFITEVADVARTHARKRATKWMATASILSLCASAALEFHGTRGERTATRARRAALAPALEPVLAARDSLATLQDRMSAIASLAERGPTWTPLLLDLAMLLPYDAFVQALRGQGDSVLIEGWAAQTAGALEGLRAAGTLRSLRLEGAIRRETGSTGNAIERFALVAALAVPNRREARSR